MIAVLGILSGCLTTLSWVPQLVRTWKRGHADDISGLYLLTFGTGVSNWIVYGILKPDVAVIFANALTLVLLIGLVAMKYARAAPENRRATHENGRATHENGRTTRESSHTTTLADPPTLEQPVAG